MTVHMQAPPCPQDLLRQVSRLSPAWRGRYAVLRNRMGVAKAARTVLTEYRAAELEDSKPTDIVLLSVEGRS